MADGAHNALPGFPLWVIALNYLLDVVILTLIGRFAMGLFLAPDKSSFFMRFFVRVSDLIRRWFASVTPGFLICGLVPLYISWFFFMAHFHLMPWLLDIRSWAYCLAR